MTTITPAPSPVNCRCCGQPITPDYQKPILSPRMIEAGITKPGRWMLTCKTPGCGLEKQTFTIDNYADADLSGYYKSEAGR